MIINHNMQSINAHRQMGVNATNQSKSTEKLSSGLRINRAGDDAAGLAISEKMRGQIRGLDQAGRNAQDGISLIQTAEGALNETHSILQRMRELSVQSANDTNTDADRAELQKEIEQLTKEVDRIADTTEFNTQTLLKGDNKQSLEGTGKATMGAVTAGTDTTHTSTTVVMAGTATADDYKLQINGQSFEFKGTAGTAADNAANLNKALQEFIDGNDALKGQYEVSVAGSNVTLTAVAGGKYEGAAGNITATGSTTAPTITAGTTTAATAANMDITFAVTNAADAQALVGKGLTIGDKQVEFYDASKGAYEGDAIGIDISSVTNATTLTDAIIAQAGDKITDVKLSNAGGNLNVAATTTGAAGTVKAEDGGKSETYKVNLQVGANEGQKMSVEIGDMGAKALGVNKISVSSAADAEKATTIIDEATAKVSAQRAQLGAFQNRLEHTINNLGTSSENLTAAESRIRDVDMAKEMMNFTKTNVLNQAAQAMLAQANQLPNQVLSLLR